MAADVSLGALSVAVDMAVRARDEARRLLQSALNAQQAAQQQMAQLQAYAGETQDRWGLRANAQVQPEVMFHHYQFMERLHHAMGLQSNVVENYLHRVDAGQRALLAAELRLASLKKLVDKRRAEWMQQQSRREQKQTDEQAALQYRNAFKRPEGQEL